mgnify:CR=1 FL=1
MKENKNIDRLFQERLSNLDVAPNEEVWQNIELRLKEKKKKRVIPFWWKLSGIAAAFVIGLGIYNFTVNDNTVSNDVVIDANGKKENTPNPTGLQKLENNEVVSDENNEIKNNSNSSKLNEVEIDADANTSSKNNTAVANNSDGTKYGSKNSDVNSSSKNNNAVANNSDGTKNGSKNSDVNTSSKNNTAIANNSDRTKNSSKNYNVNTSSKNNTAVANNSDRPKNSSINSDVNTSSKNNTAVAKNADRTKNERTNSDLINTSISNNLDANKSEIEKLNKNSDSNLPINKIQIIAEKTNSELKKDEIKKIDSTSIASVVPNAMEELLIEKEKKTSKEPKLNRWQLSSNVAPIYFSSASNGSPLDSELKNNSKTYKTNFSYGLGVNYAVNKKIKVRSGINAVSLNYDTNDVLISQNANAKSLDHVKPNAVGAFIQVESKNSVTTTGGTMEIASSGNALKKFNSTVNQQIGYLEIPLELSYKLVDKKFGVDVIGGVSTLLLNQNEVSVISSGVEMNIGEANNLNDIHFSTNVGLGFKYGFFKNFEARVEPVFKYQINTFIKDSGDFKPYFFGLYSGVTFTF